MYTELVIKADLIRQLPPQVDSVLQFLFKDGEDPADLPAHKFFKCERWQMIGRCNSYYHIPACQSFYREGYLFSRSDLKNYDNEIDCFIDWIEPYLAHCPGDCIGWKWYEESVKPDLIFMKGIEDES